MKKQINKKVVAIVAIVALVAILGICLVACNNQEDFEKRLKDKDYVVVSMTAEQLNGMTSEDIGEVDWAIMGTKGNMVGGEGDYVMIVKLKKESDAKDCEAEMNEELPQGFKCVRKGSIIIAGTEQAVDDAQ